MHFSVIFCVLLCCYMLPVNSEYPEFVDSGKGDGSGSIKLKAAELDEEESHSDHMPSSQKCDACRIIAYLLREKFTSEHEKMKSLIKKKGRLGEADMLAIFDTVCDQEFDTIGVKEVNGETRLSGPGLETKDVPGLMQGGGKWPNRLRVMCERYAGDIGEDEIYSTFLQKKNLEDFLCRGTGIQGYCNLPRKKKPKKTEKEKEMKSEKEKEDKKSEKEKEDKKSEREKEDKKSEKEKDDKKSEKEKEEL